MDSYNGYGNDFGYGNDDFGSMFGGSDIMAALGIFFGFIAVFVIITWAIGLVLYILQSIGLYKLAENRGMSGAALAWIPMIGFYRIGSIADDIMARNGGRSYYRYILLIGGILNIVGGGVSWIFSIAGNPILSSFMNGFYGSPYRYRSNGDGYYGEVFAYWGISMLLMILSIALVVFLLIALNKIYKCYRPMSSTSWTVLSVIFPFMQSIFLFILRNAVPAAEWGAQGYYPMQNQQWQTPPQYMPYGGQPPVNGGYPVQGQGWQAPPPPPPPQQQATYQPPVAPNPPEPWEIENHAVQPPPRAPWEQNNGDS